MSLLRPEKPIPGRQLAYRREETVARSLAATLAIAGLLVPALGEVLGEASAEANRVKSLYTTIDLKACKKVRRHRDGGAWMCDGLAGLPVYVAEGDLRQFVSVGAEAQKRRAATQTLGAFNSIFETGGTRATVEWRFDRRGERKLPYATIMRFHTSRDGRRGDVLVVSKVSDAETCHVAYIDALANRDAIALARHVADRQSKSFDCSREPRTEGATGRSPM
jgi:hypothetical protein